MLGPVRMLHRSPVAVLKHPGFQSSFFFWPRSLVRNLPREGVPPLPLILSVTLLCTPKPLPMHVVSNGGGHCITGTYRGRL